MGLTTCEPVMQTRSASQAARVNVIEGAEKQKQNETGGGQRKTCRVSVEQQSEKQLRREDEAVGTTKVAAEVDFFPRPIQVGFEMGEMCPPLEKCERLMTDRRIMAHFDGANRGNGLARKTDKNQKSAVGMVIIDEATGRWLAAWAAVVSKVKFRTPDGAEHQVTITGGNNKAEMLASIELMDALLRLKTQGAKFTTAVIVGDSAFTLADDCSTRMTDCFTCASSRETC